MTPHLALAVALILAFFAALGAAAVWVVGLQARGEDGSEEL